MTNQAKNKMTSAQFYFMNGQEIGPLYNLKKKQKKTNKKQSKSLLFIS